MVTSFYQRPASHVYYYAVLNLRNLLYFKELAGKAGRATADVAQHVGKGAVVVAEKTKELTEKSQQAILGAIDQNGNGEVDIEDVIIMGLKVPGIRIDGNIPNFV